MTVTESLPHSYRRQVVGTFLLLGVAIGAYFFFAWISGLQVDTDLRAAYGSLALDVMLVFAALSASRIPALLLNQSLEKTMAPAVSASASAFVGLGVWRGLSAFSSKASVMPGIGLVCLSGAVALAVSHLATYAERRQFGGSFSGIFRWLAETRSLVVVMGLLGGVYVCIIRPLFMGKSGYSVLSEWIIILMLGVTILAITRLRIARSFVEEDSSLSDWRRHRQQVDARTNAHYVSVRSLEQRFVEESDQTMLLHYLISLLASNSVNESDIAGALKPLIGYRPRQGRGRGASREEQQEERERLLNGTISRIQAAAEPSRYSRYSARMLAASGADEEPKTISALADDFCRKGDCTKLLVRLSLVLSAAGTRTEDIDEVLQPLLTRRQSSQDERERLWREITQRVGRYQPRVSLKE